VERFGELGAAEFDCGLGVQSLETWVDHAEVEESAEALFVVDVPVEVAIQRVPVGEHT
jgi:hypothetical protein